MKEKKKKIPQIKSNNSAPLNKGDVGSMKTGGFLKNNIIDVIIIGAGAAGLFSAINIPKKYKKLILEKNKNPGVKVLLSGGERANVSNMDIEGERDYFGQNKKALKSIFTRYNQWDLMSWFAENGIILTEEDRGRLILESGDSSELLNILVKKAGENNSEIKCENDVKIVRKIKQGQTQGTAPTEKNVGVIPCVHPKIFEIITEDNKKYYAKNVIVSSGGKSFFQVGTTGEGYNFAQNFGVNIIPPHRGLCGITTKKDFSELSGSSIKCSIELFDKPPAPLSNGRGEFKEKLIYSETGPLLFTHFGLSGPIIFNTANAMGEYLNSSKLSTEGFSPLQYILENIFIKITISEENSTKKVTKFFSPHPSPLLGEERGHYEIITGVQDWRSWKEAKATGGGIDLNELDKFMQSKKVENLFFVGEVCDILGKTGGFNLQWAWSSGYCCGEFFKK